MIKYLYPQITAFLWIHDHSNTKVWWRRRGLGWKTKHPSKKPSFILQNKRTNVDFYAQASWGLAVDSWGYTNSTIFIRDPARMARGRSLGTSFCWRRLHSNRSDFPDLRVLATAKEPQEVHEIKAHFKICPSWTIPHRRNGGNKKSIRKGQKQHILQIPRASFQSFDHSAIFFFLYCK